jgi:hypothetical protein
VGSHGIQFDVLETEDTDVRFKLANLSIVEVPPVVFEKLNANRPAECTRTACVLLKPAWSDTLISHAHFIGDQMADTLKIECAEISNAAETIEGMIVMINSGNTETMLDIQA